MEITANALRFLFDDETIFWIKPKENQVIIPEILPIANAIAEKVETTLLRQTVVTEVLPQKKTLVLLPNKLSTENSDFFDKILTAVGTSLNETDVLNLSELPLSDFKPLLSSKTAHYFITFGVPLIKLNLDILLVPYQSKKVSGIQFLYADSLDAIRQDQTKKKQLWLCLKIMFGIT